MTDPGNYEAALRDKFRALASGSGSPEPEPVVEAAPAAEPAAVEAPVAPAVVEGSTPEVAAAPSQAAEGSPPPEQPAPASEAEPTTSAVEALTKRGFKVEDSKLAAEYLRLETEFAALKRAEKAKPAQPATEAQPVTQQAAPEPTPAPSRPAAPAPSAPEPPAAAAAPPADIEQAVVQHVAVDSTCVAIANEYSRVEASLKAIAVLDENSIPISGQLADLNAQILTLEQALAPNDSLSKIGIEIPTLDPIQRQDVERHLDRLKIQRFDLTSRFHATERQLSAVREKFNSRAQQYREHFSKDLQAKAEADRQSAESESMTAAFTRRWIAEEAAAFKDYNVTDEITPAIKKALQTAAKAHIAMNGAISDEDLPQIMRDVVKEEMDKADSYHRARSAAYAKTKISDAAIATTGPPPAAAVAPPAATENPDWEKRLNAKKRALFRSVAVP